MKKHSYETWEKMYNRAQAKVAELEKENKKIKRENAKYKKEVETTNRLFKEVLTNRS